MRAYKHSTTVALNWTDEEMATIFKPTALSPPKPKPTAIERSVFSPRNLKEFVGQENPKKLVSIMVEAAKHEKRPLPNMMLVGGYGLGKTSLAQLIIQEYKGHVSSADIKDGMSVNKEKPTSGLLIVDEIHLLDPAVADRLNIALDSGTLHIIGCTTDSGKLPAPFRSRFRTLQLENYTVAEIVTIAELVCKRKGVTPLPNVLEYIAKRSRFNARQVTMYLSMIFDLMAVRGRRIIEQPIVNEAFDLLGVDDNGFIERDRKYIRAMPDGRPVGISALSAMIGIDALTIENEIEPYLLQQGIIDRTPRGRIKLREL
jgi:Holliday junction DNA helicase RuvB